MVQPTTTQITSVPQQSRGIASAIVVGVAVFIAAGLLGGIVLWTHYGTAVFFEMIASGIATCF